MTVVLGGAPLSASSPRHRLVTVGVRTALGGAVHATIALLIDCDAGDLV